MPTVIHADDPRLNWQGILSLQHGAGWVQPWRLPHEDLALYPYLDVVASRPSSARLRFATDAEAVTFRTTPMEEAHAFDLYADGALAGTLPYEKGAEEFRFRDLPTGEKVLELWLTPNSAFQLKSIELPDGASLEASEDTRPRWVVYGSSITQCGAAGSGSTTWPGVVACERALDLTSFGFGGQCHLDPMMARQIRKLPADLLTVKAGINIYGRCSLNDRSFAPALIGTISTLRETHPETPFVVCSPILSPPRETKPNAVGMTLVQMREIVAEVVEIFRARGDRNIHYVCGLDMFGEDLAHLLPDDLHPNAEGYAAMGRNFSRIVFDDLGISVA